MGFFVMLILRMLYNKTNDVPYGLLKMTEERFRTVDRSHLLKKKKESYGYSCLTDEIRYYMENYPDITAEKGSIDEIIMMTVKGEAV